jgi:hypothetical protein
MDFAGTFPQIGLNPLLGQLQVTEAGGPYDPTKG